MELRKSSHESLFFLQQLREVSNYVHQTAMRLLAESSQTMLRCLMGSGWTFSRVGATARPAHLKAGCSEVSKPQPNLGL